MLKRIILIITVFLLMINVLIGVIHATEEIPAEVSVDVQEGGDNNIDIHDNIQENVENNINNKKNQSEKKEISNLNLGRYIITILSAFVVILFVIERKMSIRLFIRLFLTVFCVYFIYVKSLINHGNIFLCTLIILFVISFINIFIKDGIHKKSFSELISVIIISLITSICILWICNLSNVNLFYNDFKNVDNDTLVNCNIFCISSLILLGIFMDMISRITSKLDEEKNKTEDINWKDQFKVGNIIGREVIGEKINCLLFIFIGIIFPLIFVYKEYTIIEVMENEKVFVFFVISFIGNIGLLLSIPITSLIYAIFNRKKTIYKKISENKIDGKRSLKI